MEKATKSHLHVIQGETTAVDKNEDVPPEKQLAVAAFSLLHSVAKLDEMIAETVVDTVPNLQEEALSLFAVSLRMLKKAGINIADALMFMSSDISDVNTEAEAEDDDMEN